MNAAKFAAYLHFEQLQELKTVKRNGTVEPRKHPRYDLVAMAGYWPALDKLKTRDGKVYFNLVPSDKNRNRQQGGTAPDYYLQCNPAKMGSVNFSGVRFYTDEGRLTSVASGEPYDKEKLRSGMPNPMYEQRKDGFLFLFSDDRERLEVLVLEDGLRFIDAYRKQLYFGEFDDILNDMRRQAVSAERTLFE